MLVCFLLRAVQSERPLWCLYRILCYREARGALAIMYALETLGRRRVRQLVKLSLNRYWEEHKAGREPSEAVVGLTRREQRALGCVVRFCEGIDSLWAALWGIWRFYDRMFPGQMSELVYRHEFPQPDPSKKGD